MTGGSRANAARRGATSSGSWQSRRDLRCRLRPLRSSGLRGPIAPSRSGAAWSAEALAPEVPCRSDRRAAAPPPVADASRPDRRSSQGLAFQQLGPGQTGVAAAPGPLPLSRSAGRGGRHRGRNLIGARRRATQRPPYRVRVTSPGPPEPPRQAGALRRAATAVSDLAYVVIDKGERFLAVIELAADSPLHVVRSGQPRAGDPPFGRRQNESAFGSDRRRAHRAQRQNRLPCPACLSVPAPQLLWQPASGCRFGGFAPPAVVLMAGDSIILCATAMPGAPCPGPAPSLTPGWPPFSAPALFVEPPMSP